MRILLVGASGFIGARLLTALQQAGHEVVATSRAGYGPALPAVSWQALDLAALAEDPDRFAWPGGIELLINVSGVLGTDPGRLAAIQHRGPQRLFDLAAAHGARVIQLSALGAGEHPNVPFLATKAAADDCLLSLGIPAVVLRPSVVVGEGGASSGWLGRLSLLPWAPLLDTRARLQPLHVDDLVGAVLALLRQWPAQSAVLAVVGPEAMTQGGLIDRLRTVQGRGPGRYWPLPAWLVRPAARLGDRLGWRALNSQTLTLARCDNLASPDPLSDACGYRAAPLVARLAPWPQRQALVGEALRPLMLAVLLLIWLGTAVVCLGPGFDWGLRILAEAGLTGRPAASLVIAGSLCDALLGLGLLWRRWRRWALLAQLALMAAYSLIITLLLPHYWFDPFMAVGKNLAVMAVTLWLLLAEPPAEVRG